jgi:hypothetical protein
VGERGGRALEEKEREKERGEEKMQEMAKEKEEDDRERRVRYIKRARR